MNELQRQWLAGKPDLIRPWCVVCGHRATNHHHVIPKAMGGTRHESEIPLLSLCGMGNASGCHGLAHSGQLHFRWTGRWQFWLGGPCSYQDALCSDGWVDCWEEEL